MTIGNVEAGRQTIYEICKDEKLRVRFIPCIRNFKTDKDKTLDIKVEGFAKGLIRSSEPADQDKLKNIQAYLLSKQTHAEKKGVTVNFEKFFDKLTNNQFRSLEEKNNHIQVKAEEAKAKAAEELRRLTPEYKAEQLKIENEKLIAERQKLIDQNKACFSKVVPYADVTLKELIEKLGALEVKQGVEASLVERVIFVLNKLMKQDFASFFFEDLEIFEREELKRFVKKPPALVDQDQGNQTTIFMQNDLLNLKNIAEHYQNEMKDDAKILDQGIKGILVLDKKIEENKKEIIKLVPQQEKPKDKKEILEQKKAINQDDLKNALNNIEIDQKQNAAPEDFDMELEKALEASLKDVPKAQNPQKGNLLKDNVMGGDDDWEALPNAIDKLPNVIDKGNDNALNEDIQRAIEASLQPNEKNPIEIKEKEEIKKPIVDNKKPAAQKKDIVVNKPEVNKEEQKLEKKPEVVLKKSLRDKLLSFVKAPFVWIKHCFQGLFGKKKAKAAVKP